MSNVSDAQIEFLRGGGIYKMPLAKMRKDGDLPYDYAFKEYPKALRIPRGEPHSVKKTALTTDGKTETWTEIVQDYDDYTVYSAEDEERILAGGKTNEQLEEERQGLLSRCRAAGISADPAWSVVRLRRELGVALDAPPGDELAELKAKLTRLQELTSMRAQIAALEAQLATSEPAPVATVVPTSMPPVPPVPTASAYMDFGDDPEELRGQLTALGVKVDGRWSMARLRDELDRATAPSRSAA